MTRCILSLWHDEAGAVLTAELVIILTLVVLALVVGLSEVASAINCELFDVAYAIRGLNQSYAVTGFRGCWPKGGFFAGSRFIDYQQVNTCIGAGVCGNGFASGYASGFAGGFGGDIVPGVYGPFGGANGALVAPGSVIAPGAVIAPGTVIQGPNMVPGAVYVPGEAFVPGPNWQPVPGSDAHGQVCPTPGANCPGCPTDSKATPAAPATPATPAAKEAAPSNSAPKSK